MTGDLAVWLRAQLDAQEQWLRRAFIGEFMDECQECGFAQRPESPFSHAFVLADIAAKKDAVELHCAVESNYADYPVCVECSHLDHEEEPHPCTTLRLLARPYAGRPGWSDEWNTA